MDTINNWHSPIVTWLWSLLSPPLEQPSGALLIQCLMLFPYPVALLADKRVNRPLSVIFVIGLISLCGFILKDVILVALILSALGSLDYLKGYSRAWMIGTCSIIALFVRPCNFVIFAIAASVGSAFYWRGRRLFINILIALSISIAAIPATSSINRYILGAKDAFPEQSLVIFDVAGMSTVLHQDLFAALPGWPESGLPKVYECFTPLRWDPYAKWGYGDCKRYAYEFEQVTSKIGKTQILGWWIKTIASHPSAYIAHRAVFAFTLLRHMTPIEYGEPTNHIVQENVEKSASGANVRDQMQNTPDYSDALLKCKTAISTRSDEIVRNCSRLNMFIPWEPNIKFLPFDVLGSLIFNRGLVILSPFICMFLLVWKLRDRRPADVLICVSAAVGIGNFLMLIVFGVASDGRYMLPTLVGAIVCLFAVLKAWDVSKISSTRRETSASYLESKPAL